LLPAGQEPPEVTSPEPLLADGAVVLFRPLPWLDDAELPEDPGVEVLVEPDEA
jgi:hypothetical protein